MKTITFRPIGEEERDAIREQYATPQECQQLLGLGRAMTYRYFGALPQHKIVNEAGKSEKVVEKRLILGFHKMSGGHRGNPKFHDSGFQSEMAHRRWHRDEEYDPNMSEILREIQKRIKK